MRSLKHSTFAPQKLDGPRSASAGTCAPSLKLNVEPACHPSGEPLTSSRVTRRASSKTSSKASSRATFRATHRVIVTISNNNDRATLRTRWRVLLNYSGGPTFRRSSFSYKFELLTSDFLESAGDGAAAETLSVRPERQLKSELLDAHMIVGRDGCRDCW